MHDPFAQVAPEVLAAYGLEQAELTPIVVGHINRTFEVRAAHGKFVLQWLNPIFSPEIHHDIDAITRRLAEAGVQTPRLVRTRDDRLWTADSHGQPWRLLTFVPGTVVSRATHPAQCRAAGVLAARFHDALRDLRHTFHSQRLGVHDTPAHLARLRQALVEHRGHVAYDQVAPVAETILTALDQLPDLGGLPTHIAHGDMKVSNIIYSDDGREALAFVDLDTLAPMAWPIELGDALRSWCADGGEDSDAASFALDRFDAALSGYASQGPELLTAPEQDALVPAVETICLELASRFAADVLRECYFNWDRQRFGAAWQHHLLRARSQVSLWRSFAAQRAAARDTVARVFCRTD